MVSCGVKTSLSIHNPPETTKNESDNGAGDGNTVKDIVVLDDFHFRLRAERSATGNGRIYTITYKVIDDCGNSSVQSVAVTVPLSKGKIAWQIIDNLRYDAGREGSIT